MEEQKTQPQNNKATQQQEKLSAEELKGVVEALLFATQKPLSVREIKEITETEDSKFIKDIIEDITKECVEHSRSFKLVEIAGGFQFTTDGIYAKWLRKLYKVTKSDYLTKPSLETLSIIAYKQPITKAEMEFIRGVNVDGVVKNLLQKGLIRISGKKKVPGTPFLYSSTRFFLQYFGLNSLQDLPQLSEFSEADIQLPEADEMLVENLSESSDEETAESESSKEENPGLPESSAEETGKQSEGNKNDAQENKTEN
jgi:segregation and condensation protein B